MDKLLISQAEMYLPPQVLCESLPKGTRVLLESTLYNEKNRWAILTHRVDSIFKSDKTGTVIDGVLIDGNPFEILANSVSNNERAHQKLPFLGGWIGCISYEAVRFLEKVPTKDMQDFDLLFYYVSSFFLFDLYEQKLFCISSTGGIPELKHYLSIAKRKTHSDLNLKLNSPPLLNKNFVSSFSKANYLQAINQVREYILDGHSYQVNLSQRFCFENKVDPFLIYRSLSSISPVPYAGFFEHEGLSIISGSPERLFEIKDRTITTRPIAGTRRMGSEEEKKRFIEELNKDPKEHAEHCMLVDLERNDLGRICEYGSVHIKEFMDIICYKTVIHTESEVQGTLKKDVGLVEVFRALFPGGTITGVPKIRTMEIIHELEPCPRGIYTGALGYISICGHSDFNIMIRPIICKEDKAYTHAGGGITIKSHAEQEYKETLHKARSQIFAILHANGELS